MPVNPFKERSCDHICPPVPLCLRTPQNTPDALTETFPNSSLIYFFTRAPKNHPRSLVDGSQLHLELVEMFPDDFISPAHLPQETRKHGIGEFLVGNRQHNISLRAAASVGLA